MEPFKGNTANGGGFYGKRYFQTGDCCAFSRPAII